MYIRRDVYPFHMKSKADPTMTLPENRSTPTDDHHLINRDDDGAINVRLFMSKNKDTWLYTHSAQLVVIIWKAQGVPILVTVCPCQQLVLALT